MTVKKTEVLVIGAICVILGILIYPVLVPAREEVHRSSCLSHLKQLATAVEIYRYDGDERLPPELWTDAISPYVKNEDILNCTELRAPLRYGYAYNFSLVGAPASRFPEAKTVLFFETAALGRNVVANLAARDGGRHNSREGSGSIVSYLDSHARFVLKGDSP